MYDPPVFGVGERVCRGPHGERGARRGAWSPAAGSRTSGVERGCATVGVIHRQRKLHFTSFSGVLKHRYFDFIQTIKTTLQSPAAPTGGGRFEPGPLRSQPRAPCAPGPGRGRGVSCHFLCPQRDQGEGGPPPCTAQRGVRSCVGSAGGLSHLGWASPAGRPSFCRSPQFLPLPVAPRSPEQHSFRMPPDPGFGQLVPGPTASAHTAPPLSPPLPGHGPGHGTCPGPSSTCTGTNSWPPWMQVGYLHFDGRWVAVPWPAVLIRRPRASWAVPADAV